MVEPRPGVASSLILFEGAGERVALEEWQAEADIELANAEGLELLVLAGGFVEGSILLFPGAGCDCPPANRFAHGPGRKARKKSGFKSAPLLHDRVCQFESIGDEARPANLTVRVSVNGRMPPGSEQADHHGTAVPLLGRV